MSRRLTPVTRRALIKRLKDLGWEGPFHGTNHDFMQKELRQVRIPNPHKHRDIGIGLLDTILKQAGIARDEWLE